MSDVPFFKTTMGHKFYEHTMPELVRQLTRLNAVLERLLQKYEDPASKKATDGKEGT
jgi:hypothetical protein